MGLCHHPRHVLTDALPVAFYVWVEVGDVAHDPSPPPAGWPAPNQTPRHGRGGYWLGGVPFTQGINDARIVIGRRIFHGFDLTGVGTGDLRRVRAF